MLIYVTTQVNRWWEIAICSGPTFNEGRIPRKTRILLSDYKDRLRNSIWICCAECNIPSGLRQHLESEGCRVSLLSQWPITVSNAKLLFNVHGNYGDIYLRGILGDNRYRAIPWMSYGHPQVISRLTQIILGLEKEILSSFI